MSSQQVREIKSGIPILSLATRSCHIFAAGNLITIEYSGMAPSDSSVSAEQTVALNP